MHRVGPGDQSLVCSWLCSFIGSRRPKGQFQKAIRRYYLCPHQCKRIRVGTDLSPLWFCNGQAMTFTKQLTPNGSRNKEERSTRQRDSVRKRLGLEDCTIGPNVSFLFR